jgi:hypothetical protein
MKASKSMQSDLDGIREDQKKLVDLLSRVNGGIIEIPKLDLNIKSRDRRVDKICLSISLLKNKYPYLELVPWALLRFIALSNFRYGVRSIVHLIDYIPGNLEIDDKLELSDVSLPINSEKELMNSSLAYHLISDDEPENIVETWQEMSDWDTLIRFERKEEE